MSLQDWLESGRLRAHKTGRHEIDALLAAADRDLADGRVRGLSEDRRFATAYSASLPAATAALVASGYRAPQVGHHYWTIQSLAFTLNLDARTIEKLDASEHITDPQSIAYELKGRQRVS